MKAAIFIALLAITAVVAENGGWSGWSECTRLCDGGIATRTCTNPPPSDGGADCLGLSVMACNSQACRNCTVAAWSGFSYCTKSCGIGTQYRTRRIIQSPGIGGTPCPITNQTQVCNTYFCYETLGGKGYYFWGPLKGPGPLQWKISRIDTEIDVFLFDQANFFQYQYDAARIKPYQTNYVAVRSSLNVENSNEIVPLDTTSSYYLVVDHTLVGAAQGTTQNKQQVFNANRFYWWIGGLEYEGKGVNTVPYYSGATTTTSSVVMVSALIAAVIALLQ